MSSIQQFWDADFLGAIAMNFRRFIVQIFAFNTEIRPDTVELRLSQTPVPLSGIPGRLARLESFKFANLRCRI